MKAYRDERTGLLEVMELDEATSQEKRLRNSPLFKRFEAGLAAPDLMEQEHYAQYALMIVGEQEDGLFSYFQEEFGDAPTIIKLLIDWKDRLLISRIHVAGDDEEFLNQLRDPRITDGLCSYDWQAETDDGVILWTHEPSHWKYFRDRETYAPVVSAPPDIRANPLAGYQMIRRLYSEGRAGERQESLIFANVVKGMPSQQKTLNHPIIRAAVYVTSQMERDTRAVSEKDIDESQPWYSRPKK